MYSIPDETLVRELILRVLHEKYVVSSQAALTREVLKHLKRLNEEFSISGKRLRKIALKMEEVSVEIRCKTSTEEVFHMETCPVCGEKMERIVNLTLEGKKIVVGFRCSFCPYWTGRKLRVPTRYIFRLV
ncbi:MAG: hypothetical protein GXO25_07565 [Euryarchaeota archaeon]|nr:hypothetical protein [Euryarchaeota archaeon]